MGAGSSAIIAFLITTNEQMHNKGARHIAAESRLREKELSKKHEINKRQALSAYHSNSGNLHTGVKPTNIMEEKPLIEQTRRAILEAQSSRLNDFNSKKVSHDFKWTTNTSSCDYHVGPSNFPTEQSTVNTGSVECNRKGESFTGNQTQGKLLSDWQIEVRKRQEQELQFTASGWKRDGHGKWYKDESVSYISFALFYEHIAIRQRQYIYSRLILLLLSFSVLL